MSVSFAVDDVEVATKLPATKTLRELLGDVLAFGGDGEMRVLAAVGVHPLLAAVHTAFAEHRPLVLSPDAVWLTIAQGVAQHVRLHADELRPRLMRHEGRRDLQVTWPGPFPTDEKSLGLILHAFRRAVGEQVGDGRARLLTCDFSTTTEVERVASEIVLLDAFSPYFDYRLYCVCGIPRLTLTGTPDDWRAIRERIDVIAELDLGWWTKSLALIADRLVAAAQGNPDVAFFRSIYKPKEAYGGERITGWIARLFPYLASGGAYERRNPLLDVGTDERGWYKGDGIASDEVPARASSCLVKVRTRPTARRST